MKGLNNAWRCTEAEKMEAAPDLQPERVRLEIRDDGASGCVLLPTLLQGGTRCGAM